MIEKLVAGGVLLVCVALLLRQAAARVGGSVWMRLCSVQPTRAAAWRTACGSGAHTDDARRAKPKTPSAAHGAASSATATSSAPIH
jgi:hypothetical protein